MDVVHITRLNKLASILDSLTEGQFNIDDWSNTCGSVCCAGGWAARDPEFNQQGLTHWRGIPIYLPNEAGYDSLMFFFGLDCEQTKRVFSPYSYYNCPTPKEVADRIRHILLEAK